MSQAKSETNHKYANVLSKKTIIRVANVINITVCY